MIQQVNLYTAQFPPKIKLKLAFKYVLLLTIIVGAGLVGGVITFLEIESKKELLVVEKKLLDSTTKKIAALKNLKNNDNGDKVKLELVALQDVIKHKKMMLNALKEQTAFTAKGFSERYIALARQDVKGLWLTSIVFDGDSGDVVLQGATINAALLTEYLSRLSKEMAFSGVSFRVLKIDDLKVENASDNQYFKFSVSTIDPPSGVPHSMDVLKAKLKR